MTPPEPRCEFCHEIVEDWMEHEDCEAIRDYMADQEYELRKEVSDDE